VGHFRIPSLLVDRESYVLNACVSRSVLHLGCADFPFTEESIEGGRWLHSKITQVAAQCVGVDLDESSIAHLRERHGINNIVQGNAEHLDQLNIGHFDVILAGEIIEHLNNPGLFLSSARKLLKPNGRLIITTTNAFCLRRFLRIPFSVESIHPDHTYYFSHATLRTLAGRFGYAPVEMYSYRIPNKKPLLPYVVERFATLITPNWGEGLIHVYTA